MSPYYEDERQEGWAWPAEARKGHYFVDGRSLCGKWAWFARFGLEPEFPYDKCAECSRKESA